MNKDFTPTYLYIKQHSITKKLYFGKTINNPETYPGSGTLWRRHLRKHGARLVENLWYCLFLDVKSIREFALNFSDQQCIVSSKEWLNLTIEDGTSGVNTHTDEAKEKNRIAHIGKKASDDTRKKMSVSGGHAQTEESKEKIRQTLTGVSHTEERVEKMRASKLTNPSSHRKGSTHSDEAKEKNRLAHLGKKNGPYKTVMCPHCCKEGAGGVMKRYHFDNCKFNTNGF